MNQRVLIYAFLSRVFSDVLDKQAVFELSQNSGLLDLIGVESSEWFKFGDLEKIEEELNIDFSSMFLLHTQPIESFVLDSKQEALVGLQNPVMAFYFQNGFEINMNQTEIISPDHLGIEFGFMQSVVFRDEVEAQKGFLREHLLKWVVPYLLGMKSMATTPFYRELFDFTIEFLLSDYEQLQNK
ncbi:putative component of anaerobic dehydrogenase [Thiovulum sp. ES]|nr:putative component of anaerobic dehydrogenase [Thiovulum sp. ES]